MSSVCRSKSYSALTLNLFGDARNLTLGQQYVEEVRQQDEEKQLLFSNLESWLTHSLAKYGELFVSRKFTKTDKVVG